MWKKSKEDLFNKKPPCGAFLLLLINRQFRYFIYNEDNQLIAEYDNNNNVIAEYYYFGLRPVAVKTNGRLHIVHTDYLGTPRVITTGTNGGSIVWEWKNDNPYGNNKAEGSIEFNIRFAGQYYDYENSLHYNIYRTYNPETGRYMQSDPIGLAGGFIGGVFGSLAEGAKRISLNAIMAESGNKVETAIANTYGTAWTNIINVYANVAGLFTSGKK